MRTKIGDGIIQTQTHTQSFVWAQRGRPVGYFCTCEVSSLIHRVRDVAEFTAVIMELVGVDDESATLGQTHTSEVGH
jgi:hypothetical protein